MMDKLSATPTTVSTPSPRGTVGSDHCQRARTGIWTAEDLRERCHVDEFDCWHWRGGGCNGTLRFWFGPLRQVACIGTVISFLTTGKRTRKGYVWRPTCSTPECANPAHYAQITLSKARKGVKLSAETRARMCVANRARARIPEEVVAAIRASDLPKSELAKKFGINGDYANMIRAGKSRIGLPGAGYSVFSWQGVNT